MHRRSHFFYQIGIFFDRVADYDDIRAGLTVEIGLLRITDPTTDYKRDLDMTGYGRDHFLADGMAGSAARVHIDQFHAQHLSCHRRTKSDLILVRRDRRCIADIADGRRGASVNDHITGGDDLKPALTHRGRRNDMLTNKQFRVTTRD